MIIKQYPTKVSVLSEGLELDKGGELVEYKIITRVPHFGHR